MIAGFLVSLIMSFSAARRQTVPSAGVQGSIYEKYIRREQGRGRKKKFTWCAKTRTMQRRVQKKKGLRRGNRLGWTQGRGDKRLMCAMRVKNGLGS